MDQHPRGSFLEKYPELSRGWRQREEHANDHDVPERSTCQGGGDDDDDDDDDDVFFATDSSHQATGTASITTQDEQTGTDRRLGEGGDGDEITSPKRYGPDDDHLSMSPTLGNPDDDDDDDSDITRLKQEHGWWATMSSARLNESPDQECQQQHHPTVPSRFTPQFPPSVMFRGDYEHLPEDQDNRIE